MPTQLLKKTYYSYFSRKKNSSKLNSDNVIKFRSFLKMETSIWFILKILIIWKWFIDSNMHLVLARKHNLWIKSKLFNWRKKESFLRSKLKLLIGLEPKRPKVTSLIIWFRLICKNKVRISIKIVFLDKGST
jgi:hypothetical protein